MMTTSSQISKASIETFFSKIKKDVNNKKELEEEYRELLTEAIYGVNNTLEESRDYITLLYKIILYTRDIIFGQGEYMLSYMFLGVWVQLADKNTEPSFKQAINQLVFQALKSFVRLDGFYHPYGSWKDLKYFCNYLKEVIAVDDEGNPIDLNNYPIFVDSIQLILEQLYTEHQAVFETAESPKSLLCKWLPREKSGKFGWLVPYIASAYYASWLQTPKNHGQYKRALRKCLTHYRKLVSAINKKIEQHVFYNEEQCINPNMQTITTTIKTMEEILNNSRYEWAEDSVEENIYFIISYNSHDTWINPSYNKIMEPETERAADMWEAIVYSADDYKPTEVIDEDEDKNDDDEDKNDEAEDKNDEAEDTNEEEEEEDESEDKNDEAEDINEEEVAYIEAITETPLKKEESKSGWFSWVGWK